VLQSKGRQWSAGFGERRVGGQDRFYGLVVAVADCAEQGGALWGEELSSGLSLDFDTVWLAAGGNWALEGGW
jgi:hypothetical protein